MKTKCMAILLPVNQKVWFSTQMKIFRGLQVEEMVICLVA